MTERLLIAGGTGSLGHMLVEKFKNIYDISIYSRGETKQWLMKMQYPELQYIIGDIRNEEATRRCILRINPHKIIIASALKHIDICERNIEECIDTNINGIKNMLNIITEYSSNGALITNTVVFVSTDKACYPVNAYGMCKAVSERLVAEKSLYISHPRFVIVRYGNVLNSRGSIVPFFNKIAEDETKEFFPVTDENMTRFFLTLEDSVNLIKKAIDVGESGDTIIPKINSFKILDLANMYSEKYNKPVKIIGIRPGEKIHECLINNIEKMRVIEYEDIFIIKPCYTNIINENKLSFEHEYDSSVSVKPISEFNLDGSIL